MTKKQGVKSTPKIVDIIIDAIQEKKGEDIISLDLKELNEAVCDYFIVCHGDSSLQVKAISDAVEEYVYSDSNERIWHKEGYENFEWVLLDYVNIIVHVFRREKRYFYNIEELWSDAVVKKYKSA